MRVESTGRIETNWVFSRLVRLVVGELIELIAGRLVRLVGELIVRKGLFRYGCETFQNGSL